MGKKNTQNYVNPMQKHFDRKHHLGLKKEIRKETNFSKTQGIKTNAKVGK